MGRTRTVWAAMAAVRNQTVDLPLRLLSEQAYLYGLKHRDRVN